VERRACRRLEQLPGWLDGRVLWFDDGDLRRLASGRSYERGTGYVDAIGELDELPDGVVATVHGGAAYRVTLLEGDDRTLAGACSCPYGQEGAFCKHCVAVGLALLADAPAGAPWDQPRPARRARQASRKTDLRGYLSSVDPAELVDLLLELAADDPALHRRLSLRAATSGDPDAAEPAAGQAAASRRAHQTTLPPPGRR